jgi:polysaccharide deacetylase 2 family uncharacterized protein YibQ
MLNKINKERRRSMNATPTRSSNKSKWQGAQTDVIIEAFNVKTSQRKKDLLQMQKHITLVIFPIN